MNSDIVKPIPGECSRTGELPPRVLVPLGGQPELHGKRRCPDETQRLADHEPGDDREHQRLAPIEYAGADDDPGVREREHREHQVARARTGIAQHAVGRRFQSVVDRVDSAQRGFRWPVAQAAPRRGSLLHRGWYRPAA
jgi:hypothetical protein